MAEHVKQRRAAERAAMEALEARGESRTHGNLVAELEREDKMPPPLEDRIGVLLDEVAA